MVCKPNKIFFKHTVEQKLITRITLGIFCAKCWRTNLAKEFPHLKLPMN